MSAQRVTYGFAALVLAIVGILVVPLPPPLLDALLAFNLVGSGVILLLAIAIHEPLEFASFAPALLLATLFRLALDVSATRLILTQGNVPGGVGEVVPAFGNLVVHGNLVVGLIVFAILVTIQFAVIASGSQRVAEVAARFTLDAMPGKQMAIDAEVHAGLLDADGARRKRVAVQKEADFYGAMDGAGKFVKGDAIAALVIVVLNLAGGVLVGIAYHAMAPLEALQTYAILSIGNALLTTLPAFLLSVSMGLMVTRVAGDGSLGVDLAAQILEKPEALYAGGAFGLALALAPELPHVPFLALGALSLAAGRFAQSRRSARLGAGERAQQAARRAAVRRPEMALGLVGVDALSIDLGPDLVALLTPPLAEPLLDRIGDVRRALAADLGIVLPGVRLRDDLTLERDAYVLRVRDDVVARGRLRLDRLLAVADPAVLESLAGERVREPVYALAGVWIASEQRALAEQSGALVFDPLSILGSHLAEISRRHASELLGRQELHTLIEHLRSSVPSLVKELGTEALPLGTVQRVFESLLRERVWPRDTVAALETLIDAAATTRDPRELTEAVRRRLVPAVIRRRGVAVLEPLVFEPAFERDVSAWLLEGSATAPAQWALHLRSSADAYVETVPRDRAALLCTAQLRPALAELMRRFGASLEVYAFAELPPEIDVRPAMLLERPVAASLDD